MFICLVYSNFITAEPSLGNTLTLPPAQLKYYEQNNFKILGAIQIKTNALTKHRLIEFSGIAWDQDQQNLIILSDRGFILHAKPIFKNNGLTDLEFLSFYHLRDADGEKLKHSAKDSEGLALINSKNNRYDDTELIISFERKPRVVRYTVDGKYIFERVMNNDLNNIDNYEGANKALEAITLHNHFNVITGPERPLNNNNSLSLHTLNNKQWLFEPNNKNYGSLVGLTTLPDDRIIALERIFLGVFAGISNVIHLLAIEENSINQETLLKLQPGDGYFNENFEGISWHEKNRFFMISDDNDNLFQRTLLIYFEIPNLEYN